MSRKFSEQELIRREKLKTLKAKKIASFGTKFLRNTTIKRIINEYSKYDAMQLNEKFANKDFTFAGRIMTKRGKGKAGFCDIKDFSGRIQLYIRQDNISEKEFNDIWLPLDLGDIVGISGQVMKTKVGELSIKVKKITFLTKALKPLPDKYHGLKDEELRARNRAVDLIVNDETKFVALTRPKIIRCIQNYLDENDFIEVETPILNSTLGGASAKPFSTFHNTLQMPFYLRIATELPLKKLVVGGFEKVYEIGRLFRNEGVSKKHNPEFTSIEIYQAYADYEDMMELAENIFKQIDKKVFNNQQFYEYEGHKIDLHKPFAKVSMVEIIKKHTKIDFSKEINLDEAKKLAKKHNIEWKKHWTSIGYFIYAIFEELVEPKIINPTFVYSFPIEVSPLAKKNQQNPLFADRFELFILGREYANAFSELNDPIDQLSRFQKQVEEKKLGNDEANEIDWDYINALEYGLPPTGGIGIGIDRLIMFFTCQKTIRNVILFPHLKNKEK